MGSTRTAAFHTLGCKLNFSETSTLARSLEEAGYARVKVEDRPDVFVLNTCSVTENADKECRRHVRRFKAINPEGFIAVVGCYAQLKPEEIAAIPGVDLVLGANEKFDIANHIEACIPPSPWERAGVRPHSSPSPREQGPGDEARGQGGRAIFSPIKEVKRFIPSYNSGDRTRTFLKVQDGCDYFCSFCTIPLARGRSRSGTIAETVAQAESIGASGVKEIVLTGVNTGDFGKNDVTLSPSKGDNGTNVLVRRAHHDNPENFLQLIEALDRVQGIERFRISSIEPNLCNDTIIDFVAQSDRFAPHFHMPLQSGSDVILQRMRRRYDTVLYAERVTRIKERMPHACIGVDVITGTPGETEEEFLKTHEFLRSIPVDYLHVFTYSERANTTALRMADAVPMEIRRERTKQLRILGNKLQRAFYDRHIGSTRNVLFEAETSAGSLAEDSAVHASTAAGSLRSSGDPAEVSMLGFTDNYLRVAVPYDPTLVNTIIPVELGRINGDGHLIGTVRLSDPLSVDPVGRRYGISVGNPVLAD